MNLEFYKLLAKAESQENSTKTVEFFERTYLYHFMNQSSSMLGEEDCFVREWLKGRSREVQAGI